MGFFEDIGKSITDASQSAVQKGKDIADVAKYNSQISDEEKKVAGLYEQLGRKYVELYGESPDDSFKEYVDSIKQSEEAIIGYKDKVIELKGNTKCTSCGAEIPAGSMFCSVCGNKVTVPEQPVGDTDGRKCASCGAAIPVGSRFCTSCGKPVEDNNNE